MPWLSIIMALLAFFATKKKDGSNTGTALAAAGVAGLGTYYVTHETEWGKANLGQFDGVVTVPSEVTPDSPGTTTSGGLTVPTAPVGTTGSTSGLWKTLDSWGPAGTAAVIGTTGVVTSRSSTKYLPWLIGGVCALILLRKNT